MPPARGPPAAAPTALLATRSRHSPADCRCHEAPQQLPVSAKPGISLDPQPLASQTGQTVLRPLFQHQLLVLWGHRDGHHQVNRRCPPKARRQRPQNLTARPAAGVPCPLAAAFRHSPLPHPLASLLVGASAPPVAAQATAALAAAEGEKTLLPLCKGGLGFLRMTLEIQTLPSSIRFREPAVKHLFVRRTVGGPDSPAPDGPRRSALQRALRSAGPGAPPLPPCRSEAPSGMYPLLGLRKETRRETSAKRESVRIRQRVLRRASCACLHQPACLPNRHTGALCSFPQRGHLGVGSVSQNEQIAVALPSRRRPPSLPSQQRLGRLQDIGPCHNQHQRVRMREASETDSGPASHLGG